MQAAGVQGRRTYAVGSADSRIIPNTILNRSSQRRKGIPVEKNAVVWVPDEFSDSCQPGMLTRGDTTCCAPASKSWAQSSQDRSTPVVQPEYFCSQNDNPAPRHTKDRSESPCVGHALLQAQASEPIAINAPSKSKMKDQTPRSVCKKDPDINIRAC